MSRVSSGALGTVNTTPATGSEQDVNLTEVGGTTVSLGQKAMTASIPVVLSSDQSAVPVSVSSLPLPTGAATAARQDTGNTSLSSIDGKVPSLGQALAA